MPYPNNQEYRKAVLNILYFKINQMMSKINNEYFGMQLNKVVEQSEVLFKIFCTSINTKEEVEKILLERVFSECDPAIISKDPSIQELKIKYKLTK